MSAFTNTCLKQQTQPYCRVLPLPCIFPCFPGWSPSSYFFSTQITDRHCHDFSRGFYLEKAKVAYDESVVFY